MARKQTRTEKATKAVKRATKKTAARIVKHTVTVVNCVAEYEPIAEGYAAGRRTAETHPVHTSALYVAAAVFGYGAGTVCQFGNWLGGLLGPSEEDVAVLAAEGLPTRRRKI